MIFRIYFIYFIYGKLIDLWDCQGRSKHCRKCDHRVRLGNLQRFKKSYKKRFIRQKVRSKRKSVGDFFLDRKFSKILYWHFYENENFVDRKFLKFSIFIEISMQNFDFFSISKKFTYRFSFWPNFLSNEPFLTRFFLNRIRFSWRTRWTRWEFPNMWVPRLNMLVPLWFSDVRDRQLYQGFCTVLGQPSL